MNNIDCQIYRKNSGAVLRDRFLKARGGGFQITDRRGFYVV